MKQRLVDDGDPNVGPVAGGERHQKEGKALEDRRGRLKNGTEAEGKREKKEEQEEKRSPAGPRRRPPHLHSTLQQCGISAGAPLSFLS